ncbi:MAG: glycosyltransferase family 4 protein [Leptolyngbyaceae cyanobacterium RM2_2_4]|nr:glycosyltransferase family 4 protein [Leptolyngbyaceae cyanobacterium RM2_2_4]
MGFDVLAVPSQWLETGPVVVLEAHAHGLPVVGSDLGGIAEKVTHGVDGLLVAAGDPAAWAEAFARLALDEDYLNQLRAGIRPVRTISMEAAESLMVYQSVLAKQSALGNSWTDSTPMGEGDRAPVRGLVG